MKDLLKVFKNTMSLSVLQGVYIITPLIVIPFIISVFGLQGYGTLAYVIAVLAIFKVFIDYSFEFTATKSISILNVSEPKRKLKEKVSLVISTKLFLCFFMFPLYLLVGILVLEMTLPYIVISFSTLVVDVFFIGWFFQGLQKSTSIMFFRVLGRALFVLSLMLLINEGNSIFQYFIFEMIGGLIGVAVLHLYVKKTEKINMFRLNFSLEQSWLELKSGFDIFISKVCVSGYGTVNVLLLGVFVSKEVFAIYSIVEKVFNSIKMISSQFGNALIPYFANFSHDKGCYNKASLLKIIFINQAFLFASSLGLFFLGESLIVWISGDVYELQKELLIFFSISLFLSIGPVFTAILIGQGREKVVKYITLKVMLLNLILLVPFTYFYGAIGMAILILIASIYQFFLQLKSQYILQKG